MSADVTRIELAKALKTIKAVATEEQFEQTKKIFIQPGGEDSIMSAVNGLSEEDEFALLTKLLGTAKHIIGFEQRPLVEGEYIVADYYLTMKPACSTHGKSSDKFSDYKCVIDVKSTEKDLFKIGGNRLQRLRNFADLLGLPLFFGVRFLRFNNSALWAIVRDDRNATFLHVTYDNVVNGLRHVFWDEYCLTPNPQLVIIAKFSKSSTVSSVSHPDYGTQIELTFTENGGKILFTLQNEEAMMTSALMEAYHLDEIKIEKVDKDITLQYLKPTLVTAFLADLIFKTNRLPVDEFGRTIYDASKLIVRSDTDAHDKLIDRKKVELIARPLIDNHVLFVGEIKDHLALWKSLGGQE
ncbi:MAG TPA: hypothetical protein DEA97_03930 [Bacteroidales bacterium]|nr:MAG: hypothetical protein UR43_C0016G0017 [candidate division TM6 bacterium GW2011_GWF2_33_332]HBS85679.1 hypothetical protein [Bacteroidales bacterium]